MRLTRLTTACVSSLVILMLTAETWDLALNQSAGRVAGLFVTALIGTSFYVVVRQQLFVQRKHRRLSEQTVITNVSATAIVLAGSRLPLGVLIANHFSRTSPVGQTAKVVRTQTAIDRGTCV